MPVGKSFAIRLFLILVLTAVTGLAACTTSGSDAASRGGGSDDDDDDIDIPDDDIDDDVTDDADDSVPDDDSTDDATDDSTIDDSADDDDSTSTSTTVPTTTSTTTTSMPGSPYVHINSPTDGADIDGYSVELQADISDADTVAVFADSTDITSSVSVTSTQVSGTILLDGGPHTLTVTASNEVGPSSDSVSINVDMGKVVINEPVPGSVYNVRDIPVTIHFMNLESDTLHVTVDDGTGPRDLTGDLIISGSPTGTITGELPYQAPGNYTLRAWGTNPNMVDPEDNPDGIAEAYSYYSIELVDAHIAVTVDENTIQAGESVHVSYQVIDEEGADRTGETEIDWHIQPSDGATVDEIAQTVTFAQPGMFKILLSTVLEGLPISGYAYVWVLAQSPYRVEVDLTQSEITAGDSVFATATVYNEEDEVIFGNIAWSAWPSYGVSITGGNPTEVTSTRAGDITIRGTVEGTAIFGDAILTVNPGPPYTLDLILPDPVVAEGDYTHPQAVMKDEYGNRITDLGYYIDVDPTTGVVEDSPSAGDITFNSQGTYTILATAAAPYTGLTDSGRIEVVDVTAPDIELWTPERGTWVTDSTIFLSGIVHDCNYVSDRIYYSDSPTVARTLMSPPRECEFEHNYSLSTGLNIMEVKVVDDGGNSSRTSVSAMKGSKNADGSLISNGAYFRMNESGFADLSAAMMPTINEYLDQVPEMLYAMNPVFNESVEVWGIEVASARAYVTNATFGEPGFTLNSIEDLGIKLDAWVNDVSLSFNVRGSVAGIGYSVSGDVSFDQVELTADAYIYVDEYDNFTVQLENIEMILHGFSFDINNFPDALEDLFSDLVRDLVESIINDVLADTIPPLLEEYLDMIPQDFSFDFSGVDFAVDYSIDQIIWDGDGGLIKMSMGVSSPDTSPTVTDFGGSLHTPGQPPAATEFGPFVPGTSNAYGFAAMLSDEVLNQALYVFYRTGLLSQDFDAVAHTSDTLMQIVFPGLNAAYPGDVNVKLRPMLPPVMIVSPADGGTDGTLPVEIQLGDMIVNMYSDSGSAETLFLQMAVSIILPADLSVTFPDSTLQLDFGDPEMTVYVFAEPVIDFDNALFEDIAPLLADILMPLLSGLMEGIQIPSFDINGYGLYIVEERTMGSTNDNIAVFADFMEVTN